MSKKTESSFRLNFKIYVDRDILNFEFEDDDQRKFYYDFISFVDRKFSDEKFSIF